MNQKFEFKKINEHFVLFKNDKIMFINKKKIIMDNNKKRKNFLKRVNVLEKKKKISVDNLKLLVFAHFLSSEDVSKIIKDILYQLNFDNILYRVENNLKINYIMNKKLNYFINLFANEFKIKFKIVSSLTNYQNKLNTNNFFFFLKYLDVEKLTIIYKLTKISNSVILSYFFFKQKIGIIKLYNLSNLEILYNKKKWGETPEGRNMEIGIKKNLKILANFYKLIN